MTYKEYLEWFIGKKGLLTWADYFPTYFFRLSSTPHFSGVNNILLEVHDDFVVIEKAEQASDGYYPRSLVFLSHTLS